MLDEFSDAHLDDRRRASRLFVAALAVAPEKSGSRGTFAAALWR
jgi:DNA-binding SARP family transcriptional activator